MRLSLSGLKPRKAEGEPASLAHRTSDSKPSNNRRGSLSTPLKAWVAGSGAGKKMEWVRRSITAAAVAVDKAANLFIEDPIDSDGNGDDDDDDDGNAYYGMLCLQRGQGQLIQFQQRYKDFVETLGDLSLAANVDPDAAAFLLRQSRAQEDLDTMLALLRMEQRQNCRTEHARNTGDGCSGSGEGIGGNSQPDRLAAPCLEFLLEERIVKLLCELGAVDRPAGTMALVLGVCASLLGQVSHPLLPSQAVHDPISKLVTAAGSYSYGGRRSGGVQEAAGGIGALVGDKDIKSGERRSKLAQTAEEDVQVNLARLLGAVWRKLREESALLDFFFRVEGSEVTARQGEPCGVTQRILPFAKGGNVLNGYDGTEALCSFSLDVFSILLPLLELPGRAGLHAREACLVALSVKDRRVGAFVGVRTNFCAQLSRSLTARYLALYDTLEELQAAAALVLSGKEVDPVEEISAGSAAEQLEDAESKFSEALTLFLQHLRFCNAVGLVAADSQASVRPPHGPLPSGRRGGRIGNGSDSNGRAATTTESNGPEVDADNDDVASSLASQVRQLLLGEAIGPALSSELDSRAGIAQAIAARIVTELSAGVEGYGVAAAGIAARVGDEGCRRQLGPLLDEASAFLVGRESSWAPRRPQPEEQAGDDLNSVGDESLGRSDSNVRRENLRNVFLRRVSSSSPALRVSTLELLASLAELRDDRVLLDLAIRPEATTSEGKATTRKCGRDTLMVTAAGEEGRTEGSTHPLLEPGGPLEGLRVSRAMVDSFGAAFGGSPIHPNFRRFASHVSLEKYLVQAHQRQIQQLMMEARVCHGAQDNGGMITSDATTRWPVGDKAGSHSKEVPSGAEGATASGAEDEGSEGQPSANGNSHPRGTFDRSDGEEFDDARFVRQHGESIASLVDAPGSFLHALFDCLEAIFERTLDENVALTGVLSSLCLAATAAEVSPVRRLLLVVLFDGTAGAPFRSMRRVLEMLWVSAQARVASLADAPRLLARVRASLGMAAGDFLGPEDGEAEAAGTGNKEVRKPAGNQDGEAGSAAQGETQSTAGSSGESTRFLETYVFLEEFLKELFCALQAKSYVEKDARGLFESHHKGSRDAREGFPRGFSLDEAEGGSPHRRAGAWLDEGEEDENGGDGGADQRQEPRGVGKAEELPTSLDEFLRAAQFPILVSTPTN